jgi:hypothetical protein
MSRPRFNTLYSLAMLLAAFLLPVAGRALPAQQVPAASQAQASDSTFSPEAAQRFAKTYLAVSTFRDALQAELAEPKAKKPEVQAELREKLRTGVQRILKEHDFTEAEFARLTRLVSLDGEARKTFEDALARLEKK